MTTSKSCCFNPFIRNRTNSYDREGSAEKWSACICLSLCMTLLHVKAIITFLVFNNSLLLCKLFLLNNVFYNSVACITGAS